LFKTDSGSQHIFDFAPHGKQSIFAFIPRNEPVAFIGQQSNLYRNLSAGLQPVEAATLIAFVSWLPRGKILNQGAANVSCACKKGSEKAPGWVSCER
jgi:hypothetical protein